MNQINLCECGHEDYYHIKTGCNCMIVDLKDLLEDGYGSLNALYGKTHYCDCKKFKPVVVVGL